MGYTNLGREEEESFLDALKLEDLYHHTWRSRGQ